MTTTITITNDGPDEVLVRTQTEFNKEWKFINICYHIQPKENVTVNLYKGRRYVVEER